MGQSAVLEGSEQPDAHTGAGAGGSTEVCVRADHSRHLTCLVFDFCLHHVSALPVLHFKQVAAVGHWVAWVGGLGKIRKG